MITITICRRPIIIHTHISPKRTPPHTNPKLHAAVFAVVVGDASLVWTPYCVAASLFEIVVVVMQVFVSEVVDEYVAELAVGVDW
jgi:hypothetical protein